MNPAHSEAHEASKVHEAPGRSKAAAVLAAVRAKVAVLHQHAAAVVAKAHSRTPIVGAMGPAVTKVKPMLGLLSSVFGPVARLVGLGLAALAIVTGAYVKGRVEEHRVMVKHEQAVTAAVKKEQNDAIAAAEAARVAAERKFDAEVARSAVQPKLDHGRVNPHPRGVPGRVRPRQSDGFSRD